jgi:glucose-6-phosphate isomerase
MKCVQSIESAREEHIGSHGIGARALDAALARAEGALDCLRARHADRSLPLLRLPETHTDLENTRDTARQLAYGATDIVILGTGGSSLGGQTLAQLAGYAVARIGALGVPPRLHFIDNLDADTFAKLLARLPHATTRFAAISKSGGTAETLMQTIAVLSELGDAGLQTRIPDIFLGIIEPAIPGKANGLRDLLGKYHVPVLDHDPGVGGRYSAFANVGLLPAAMIGLDVAAVRAGAGLALGPVLTKKHAPQVPAAVGAALSVALAAEKGKSISIMMAYGSMRKRSAN